MREADSPLQSTDRPLEETIDGVLLDLDGVVYLGPHAVEHAAETIRAMSIPVGYVTNNASRTPGSVAEHLQELGIDALEDQVVTAAQAAAALIRTTYGPHVKVLVVGGIGLREAVRAAGFDLVGSADESPDVVVQGMSTSLTWADLAEGVYAVAAGAEFIASNLDATMPTDRGMAPGNGALIEAVVHATGVRPALAAGKPEPEIFVQAAERLGMHRPVVVGDRLDTDIRGARAAGFSAMVVLTGVVQPRDLLMAAPQERPTLIARDLRGLQTLHPQVRQTNGQWECREARARVDSGVLRLADGGTEYDLSGPGVPVTISLDGLRAACAAAWSAPEPIKFEREIDISP